MKTITINGREWKLKQNIKALIMFEKLTDKPFKLESFSDFVTLLYCCILANNFEHLDYNEFLEYLDENPQNITELSEFLQQENNQTELLSGKTTSKKKK